MNEKGLRLPVVGSDWLYGYHEQYIILSLKHSTRELLQFWMPNDLGYTPYLVQAGVYSRQQVVQSIWRYNDGVSTVAIPLTHTALEAVGLVFTFDIFNEALLNRFLNVKAV